MAEVTHFDLQRIQELADQSLKSKRNSGLRGLYKICINKVEDPKLYKLTELQQVISGLQCGSEITIVKQSLPKREAKKCKTEECQ